MGNLNDRADKPLTKQQKNRKKKHRRKPVQKLPAKHGAVRKDSVPAKKRSAASGIDQASGKITGREDFEVRSRRRDEERARRREERRRKVRRQKIIIAVSAVAIVAAVTAGVVFTRPSVRLSLSLSRGDRYAGKDDYANAQAAYEKALTIDPGSVTVYRRMADNYLAAEKEVQQAILELPADVIT